MLCAHLCVNDTIDIITEGQESLKGIMHEVISAVADLHHTGVLHRCVLVVTNQATNLLCSNRVPV